MIRKGLKNIVTSIALAAAMVMSVGFIGSSGGSAPFNSVAAAQGRNWRHNSDWRFNIRRLDRDRRVRYRTQNRVRVVGYYDRFGRFHAYGFIDRFGRFRRY